MMSGDLSLDSSLDENFNQVNGFAHSTPRKLKKAVPKTQAAVEFTCLNCKKKYVLKHYFLLHVDKCKSQTQQQQQPQLVSSALNATSTQNVHLDLSDVSFSPFGSNLDASGSFRVPSSPAPTSKKKVTQSKKNDLQLKKNFAQSKKTSVVPKPVQKKFICTYCLKGYMCRKAFKIHNRTHIIQDAASHFPDTKEIIANSKEIGLKALRNVSNGPCIGEAAAEFKDLVNYVESITPTAEFKKLTTDICNIMVQSMQKVKFLLPSTLVNSIMDDQETILSDPDLCDSLLEIINVCENFSVDVSAQFFLKFILFFTTELLSFVADSFKASHPFKVVSKTVGEPDKEDRQVIYYIAGSIMRGYLKIAKRFPNSIIWHEVVSALQSKILIEKPEGDISTDAEWTNDVDRGGLLYINAKCQDLFVKVCKVIFSYEKKRWFN